MKAQNGVMPTRRTAQGVSAAGRWTASLVTLLATCVTACRPGVPVVDPNPKPTQVSGTISGTVSGPEGTSPVVGRRVTATNATTGARQSTVTSSTGGYTLKLPPGRYRVEVELRTGESLEKQPDEVTLGESDLDYDIDFIIVPRKPGA